LRTDHALTGNKVDICVQVMQSMEIIAVEKLTSSSGASISAVLAWLDKTFGVGTLHNEYQASQVPDSSRALAAGNCTFTVLSARGENNSLFVSTQTTCTALPGRAACLRVSYRGVLKLGYFSLTGPGK
jgi:hypothetical protein